MILRLILLISVTYQEVKDFHALINNKQCFDQPVKNKRKEYEKLLEIAWNNDHTMENVLYYLHYQNYYKLIGIDLLR